MGRPRKVTPEVVKEAIRLVNEKGLSLREAARRLGVSHSGLSQTIRELGYRFRLVRVTPQELALEFEERRKGS